MADEKNIVETIKEEVADAAKAVVAEVKAVAAEVADAVAEGAADLRGRIEDTEKTPAKTPVDDATSSDKAGSGS